jgi:hypothetical protein
MPELPKSHNQQPSSSNAEPYAVVDNEAITDPVELAKYHQLPASEMLQHVVFLGVFESEAVTDPAELAKYHRPPNPNVRPT